MGEPNKTKFKKCKKCFEEKPVDEFYQNKNASDGRNCNCKSCCAAYQRAYRKTDKGHAICIISWARYRKTDHGRATRKAVGEAYRKTDKWRLSHSTHARKWRALNKEKVLAHKAIERAIKTGKLMPPQSCQICGCHGEVEAHHEDYSRKLDVVWMCRSCHLGHHTIKNRATATGPFSPADGEGAKKKKKN